MKNRVHELDLHPKDIKEALSELARMDEAGTIQGMLFVCKIRGRKRLTVGAAGCCASDPMAKVGAAGYLFGAVLDETFNE